MIAPTSPIALALTYALVGSVVIPIGFTIFKTPFNLWEVILAACVGAALSFVPTIGGIASLAATLAVLHWRIGGAASTDIWISVGVARLVMVPVLLILSHG